MSNHGLNELQKAMDRLGKFGKLFLDYRGCPMGHKGEPCGVSLEEAVFQMPELQDVEGDRWVPVLADQLHRLGDRAKLAQEWISVADRLPTVDEEVLMYAELGSMVVGAYKHIGNMHFWVYSDGDDFYGFVGDEITHWMPLPNRPEVNHDSVD